MYYSITLLIVLMMTGINMHETNSPTSSVEQTKTVKECTVKKCTKKIIDINPLKGKYTVQVGQKLRYSASIHGSVGYTATASSSDDEFLPLTKSYIKYDNRRNSKMAGGDSATKLFIFEAKKAGSYNIHALRYFRGDLENDYTIEIKVEA